MRFDSSRDAGDTVAELAQDVWQKRHHMLKMADNGILYLPYRLSVTDLGPKHDETAVKTPASECDDDFDDADDITRDHNFYVHFVVTKERWFYTINDDMPFHGTHSAYVFRDDYNNPDWDVRGESTRHYAFSDLLERAIARKIDAINATMVRPCSPFLWDTLPMETFRVEQSAHAKMALADAL